MKQMNSFREWLSTVNSESTPLQRRLEALTRLSRVRLAEASSDQPWFMWEAAEPARVA